MMQKRNGRGQGRLVAKAVHPGSGSKPDLTGIEPFVATGSPAAFIDDELKKYNEKLMDDIRKAMDASVSSVQISLAKFKEG